jgi:hypothetical protein
VITVVANGERLTVHLGNFEFITDYFGGLSLSSRRGDLGTTFMGSTRSGASSSRQAMIEDSAEEFLMASRGDGGFGLPSPGRRGTGASLAPMTTTPWMENTLATQATMMVPPRMVAPWPEANLPFERCRTCHRGNQHKLMPSKPTTEQEAAPWRSKLASKQDATMVQPHTPPRCEPTL